MKPSYQTLYDDLTAYITGHPVVNTHCHQLPDREYEKFDLDGLFRNTYVNWSGVRWEATVPSRQNFLEKVRYHYAFVWLQKSLMKIYAFETPLSATTWEEWSAQIRSAHSSPSFRQSILLERCNYRKMLLDAYWDPGSDNGDPGHFAPNFRINSFHFGFSTRAFDHDGNNPYTLYPRPFITDLDEYVAWVRECIGSRKAQGCVSLKLPIAYDRSLDFEEVPSDQARRAFDRLVAANPSNPIELQPSGEGKSIPSNAPDPLAKAGILSGPYVAEIKAFQDYLFFQICRIATELDLPIQIHTGMGQMHRTNALWLHEVIRKNPQTRFVLLHCSYPWIQDVMALVELYPNVFPDLSMLTLISTQASKMMLHELIEAATADKITWGCDTWTPEESYGSLLAFRHALASVLAEKVSEGYCSVDDAQEIVDHVMFHNANRFYRLGL